MPSPSAAEPGRYAIRPSRLALALISLLGVSFLIYLALSPLPLPLKTVLIVLGAISLASEIASASSPTWKAVLLSEDSLSLVDGKEKQRRLERLGPVFVSPLFIGLRARGQDGHRLTLGLFRGQILEEGFRALTIALKNRSSSDASFRS